MSLAGKVVIITGGTSGIGAGCTRHLAACGAKVVAASNQAAEGTALAEELCGAGHEVRFCEVDLTSEDSVAAMVAQAVAWHGRLDAVHCNAGVWAQGMVTEFDDATYNKVFGVNVRGTFLTCKHAIKAMERTGGGVLVITTSTAAHVGFPAHAAYCASKAALEALIRCLATDHAGVVRAVGVSPGTIDTPMLAASAAGWDKPLAELYADVARKIPVRRLGRPDDIAKAVAFLLSDDASYINGTVLALDGGTLALPPW